MRKFLLSTAATLSVAILSPANAQVGDSEPNSSAEEAGDEILVTAQRRSESIQSVPVAITAFSGEAIATKQISNVLDLARLVPNATMVNGSGPANSARLFIRGVGEDDSRNPDPAVGTYVDGIFVGRSIGALVEIADIERIEVLRGPQGTLYGRNSSGGAIKIISVKPQFENSGSGNIELGNYSTVRLKAMANFALSDTTAIRVSGIHKQRDAFHRLVPNGAFASQARKVGSQNIDSVRGSIRQNFGGEWSGILTLDYTSDTSEPRPSSIIDRSRDPSVVTDTDKNLFTIEPARGVVCSALTPTARLPIGCFTDYRSNVEIFGSSLAVEGKIGQFDVSSLTGYRSVKDDLSTMVGSVLKQKTDQWQVSQELTISSNYSGPFNFIGGLFYYNENAQLDSIFILPSYTSTKTESIAVFGQGSLEIVDNLSLVGGLRYTNETRKFYGIQTAARLSNSGTVKTNHLTYTAKLEYQANSDLFLYGSYATGFKTPGFSADCFSASACFKPVEKETVTTYEIGMRADIADRLLRINATYFYNYYKDLQINATVPGLGFTRTNAANAKIHGLEVESLLRPAEDLEFSLNLGWLNSKYTSLTPIQAVTMTGGGAACPGGVATVQCALGLKLKNAPPLKVNLGFQYGVPLGGGKLSFGGNMTIEDDSFGLVANDAASLIEPGTTINARVSFRSEGGRYSVSVWGKNLTDRRYFGAASTGNQVYAVEPLMFGFEAGVKF